jgi:hypothetical protein
MPKQAQSHQGAPPGVPGKKWSPRARSERQQKLLPIVVTTGTIYELGAVVCEWALGTLIFKTMPRIDDSSDEVDDGGSDEDTQP